MARVLLMHPPSFLSIFSLLSLVFAMTVHAVPLSTDSRWIVDENGQRVKLACVNWAAHLDLAVAEGLSLQPVDEISKRIVNMGFNCVRLTWPLFLATDDSLASTTVRQSFINHGVSKFIADFQSNNPSILDLPLIQAFQAVVASLSNNKVMIILDNHISKPGWCCSGDDGSGFFGDQYFNPDLWINGLTKMATLFKDNPYVIGMSLRNELRGRRQNVNDWYRYMQAGAEAVHGANPNVLVILSGLHYDSVLSFLQNQPVKLSFTGKLVFEVHWYAFTGGELQHWEHGTPGHVCNNVVNRIMNMAGFLLDQGFPLLLTEFGLDLRDTTEGQNRYLDCLIDWVSQHDIGWALWTLAGSYYVKDGVSPLEEIYGVLNWNWSDIRNSSFLPRLSRIQH